MNLDIRRQNTTVQLLRLCFHIFQDVLRLLPAQHENNALDRIIIFLKAELTEPWRMSDGDIPNIAHADRYAFVGPDNDVPDIIRVAHQPQAANVIKLSA